MGREVDSIEKAGYACKVVGGVILSRAKNL